MKIQLLLVSFNLYLLIVLNSFAGDIKEDILFGEEITQLSFVLDSDYELLSKYLKGDLELYCARATLDKKKVFMFVIKYPQSPELFFDYVFFDDKRDKNEVLNYFKARWSFLIEGMKQGFIHFEENPITVSKTLYGSYAASNLARGTVFGNIHFSRARLNRLCSLVKRLKEQQKKQQKG